jgi:hypothetical protein
MPHEQRLGFFRLTILSEAGLTSIYEIESPGIEEIAIDSYGGEPKKIEQLNPDTREVIATVQLG